MILKTNEKRLSDKLKRLYSLYAEADDDLLLETISEVKKSLKETREQIEKEAKQKEISKKSKELKTRLETLPDAWEYMTKEEQRSIITDCVLEIVATEETAKIYYKFL